MSPSGKATAARSKGSLPDFIPPQLAVLIDKAPTGDAWVHEIKLDGYRTAARIEAHKVRMLTRRGLDWTEKFAPIAQALAKLAGRATYLDGEIVVFGKDGISIFADLQEALSLGQARGRDWLKVKCANRQEFVVGGWMESKAAKRELRSLLVGYYRDGQLVFAGKVGTGFSLKVGRELMARLREHARNDPPFVAVPREYRRDVNWVEPRMVIEVKFTTWTSDGILRHPAFEGIREDKRAKLVVIERPSPER